MPHDIFGERFVSYRQPAWHGLGSIVQDLTTANEALDLMGEVRVEALPLSIALPGYEGVDVPYRVLMRAPTEDDPEWVPFGTVSEDYNLINPRRFAELWDTSVGKPIETLGFLKRGGLMFVTTKLPTMDIRGDEVENYLIAVNGMTGSNCAEARVSPVRVVCANTLAASAAAQTEAYRVVHDATAEERLALWLGDMYHKAEEQIGVLREVFSILSNTPVAPAGSRMVKAPWSTVGKLPEALATTVELAYPYPRSPRRNAPESVLKSREEYTEYIRKGQELRRNATVALFEGEGRGMDHPAAKGTLWGLYNAVVETEDYRRGGYSEDNTAFERLFGERAQTKERAFETCLALANGDDPRKIKRFANVGLITK